MDVWRDYSFVLVIKMLGRHIPGPGNDFTPSRTKKQNKNQTIQVLKVLLGEGVEEKEKFPSAHTFFLVKQR